MSEQVAKDMATEPCIPNCAAAGPVTHVPDCPNIGKWPVGTKPVDTKIIHDQEMIKEFVREWIGYDAAGPVLHDLCVTFGLDFDAVIA